MMSTVLSQASAELKGAGVQIVKIDTEKYPGIASQFQVAGLPTLMLFKRGQPVARIEGALSAPQLIQWVKSNVVL